MSQLKVNTIRHTGASSDAVTLATDGTCTAKITNNLSNRNLLINGACLLDQRNGGSSVTSGFAIDRTQIEGFDGGGSGTAQQVSDGPSGFTKSLKITVTGTDTSLASTDFYTLRQIIEGQNVSFLGFGASGGTSVTLSFWVKSSLTGTFSCSIGNGGNDRSYPKTYTISSADTWEKKTLTFPAATDGTWGTDNGRGIAVRWSLGAGSGRLGTADQWNSSQDHGATGTTNLFATNGATFFITGLQLEAGDFASDFCHEPYSETLRKCERYYQFAKGGGGITSGSGGYALRVPLAPTMRATPSAAIVDGSNAIDELWVSERNITSISVYRGSSNSVGIAGNSNAGNDKIINIEPNKVSLSAEL